MSPVRLGKRFATGHRGDLSAAMVCREMCCEMKNLARDAYLYPHRKCVYKSAADPGGSALARSPPLDRGKDTRAPCYYDNGQGRKGASFQIITIKDTGTAVCAVIPAGDYYDNGRSGKP